MDLLSHNVNVIYAVGDTGLLTSLILAPNHTVVAGSTDLVGSDDIGGSPPGRVMSRVGSL